MASTTPKLSDLSQRIARQEAELVTLRQQLEGRLADLHRRREELRTELRTVEAEIEAVAPGPTQPKAAPARPATSKPPAPVPTLPTETSFPSLPEFLLQLIREAKGQPLTLAQLQQETVRRRYPTKSKFLREMVGARVSDLVKQGRLRRDPQTGGLFLADAPNGKKSSTQPTPPQQRPTGRTLKPGAAQSSTPTPSPTAAGAGQPSLRATVLAVLKKAGRTLSAQELADRAQQAGYQSTSKHLKEVIWKMMGRIPGVERDPKGGYRLKKSRG